MHRPSMMCSFALVVGVATAAGAQFVDFLDATATNLTLGTLSPTDTQEKDIAVGDFDRDGWTDAIVVRKARFSNPGAREDVLFMNRNGTLVNETALHAPHMMTNPTDARDVRVLDVNLDGWDDIIVCNTFAEQPVLHINQGDPGGNGWDGFADESMARLPLVVPDGPLQFCAVWSGDLTGNGAPDMYFANYNPTGATTDVLLINDGTGVFTDQTDARLSSAMFGDYSRSAFGTDAEFHDADNDGDLDIIKLTTLFNVSPFNDRGVFVLFNNGDGFFNTRPFQEISDRDDPYMFEGCDLNSDGMLDVFVATDTEDSYRLATSVVPDGPNTYSPQQFPVSSASASSAGTSISPTSTTTETRT